MFPFLGKETCPIQLYGKLPLAKDYLRIGAGAGSGQALRDWLDRAFSQGGNAKDPLQLPWPAALIVGESWGQPLCAAAWPSGDAGNLRPFPFTAFVERKKKALLEDIEKGMPVSSPVLDWLAETYAARDSQGDGQSYLAAMRGRELAIGSLTAFGPEGVDFDVWVAALWPENGKDGLLECLRGLEALRKAAYRGPLRLPLVANLPSRPQVSAWFKLLVEMNLVGRDSLPTLFFPMPARGPDQPAPTPEPSPEESSDDSSSDSSSDEYAGSTDDTSESAPVEETPSDTSDSPASDAPTDGADAAPSDPAYLVLFRTTPAPADAVWLRLPNPKDARRQGDFCPAQSACATDTYPTAEGTPSLADSLHGAFAGLRGRLAR